MLIRLLTTAVLATTPVYAPATVDTAASIDAVVREYLDATGVPGAAVAVTHGRTVVRTAGYGRTARGDAVTDRTVLAVASVSKSMTALAVMQLVDAGRVRLDEPVRTYLPEFTMADDRAARITVRHLLDQSSGMSDTTFRSFSGPRVRTLREAVAAMRTARLAADPGERFEYHNPNFQVAARLVEVVGGEPFDVYLRRHVFEPLGMTDRRTASAADTLALLARGHILVEGFPLALPEPPAFGAGSGGVLSTARDMARWLVTQNGDGAPVLSAAGLAGTHRRSAGDYGLGWFVGTTRGGAPIVSHDGTMLTFTAYQALLPDSGYGVAVMVNARTGYADAGVLGDGLVDLVEGRRPAPPDTSATWIDVVLLALLAGRVPLAVRGVRRAGRWRHRPVWTVMRLLPYLAPLAVFVTMHRVAGFLYRGRDVSWTQTVYLYPAFMLLLLVTALAAVTVVAARLAHVIRRGRAGAPVPAGS
ncbi:serine hydrolase domain-containing protein [Virgisporangium ochraceum]